MWLLVQFVKDGSFWLLPSNCIDTKWPLNQALEGTVTLVHKNNDCIPLINVPEQPDHQSEYGKIICIRGKYSENYVFCALINPSSSELLLHIF
jgi:hypothetical protein